MSTSPNAPVPAIVILLEFEYMIASWDASDSSVSADASKATQCVWILAIP